MEGMWQGDEGTGSKAHRVDCRMWAFAGARAATAHVNGARGGGGENPQHPVAADSWVEENSGSSSGCDAMAGASLEAAAALAWPL
jgi:hypothetical protein